MTTVTGLTAARMAEIEAASIVDGEVVGDNLILKKFDTSTIDAGNVRGPKGDPGDPGEDGVGIAAGGSTGQVLAKVDGTDYNVAWQTINRLASVGLEWTSYELELTDAEGIVMMYSTDPMTVTIPEDADTDFPVGTQISVVQANTGTVNIEGAEIDSSPGTYVTVGYPDLYLPTLLGNGAKVDLIKLGPNAWILVGNGNLLTTENGWQTFTPTIEATGADPSLGTSPEKHGIYIVDAWKRVSGYATVRWGGTGQTQGNGYYFMKLPQSYPGVNVDSSEYSPIGAISAGFSSLGHKHGMLHFDGLSGTPRTNWAIGAVDADDETPGASFLGHNIPDRSAWSDCENIHYVFQYQHDDS
ncbi:hypothetical protein KC614_03705 [candidate division WWE3 bacterium]|uniref:Uncharacterized protein n=1 Tax=candidate division WWE3 bacterium TaxID=2053526 RepID=A0A955LK87_UNCKA|nr:hypothetical protein [candidate division WWE3 bacterium]